MRTRAKRTERGPANSSDEQGIKTGNRRKSEEIQRSLMESQKGFERIAWSSFDRESRVVFLYCGENVLGGTHSFWIENDGSRTAEMPVRRRERGGKQGEQGRATIASVLGIELEIERASDFTPGDGE